MKSSKIGWIDDVQSYTNMDPWPQYKSTQDIMMSTMLIIGMVLLAVKFYHCDDNGLIDDNSHLRVSVTFC